ncbi:hypothetical protein C8A03DRAFT_32068 [Achaetomium macrosporum]|uniref:Store-operated calcium entry-associated regulatory factor n=1 Tax=Achaetomium macrosporum TaxID=79813 RepID=A0AAN7CF97_9PEZI|nr:hypothetical protein C8A03DRAFT_32068 [Achaetomium macrosporum]
MRLLDPSPSSFLLALLTLSSVTLAARPKDAILLSDVKSLTLRSPGLTTSRRVSPIPQLKCLSSPQLCRLAGPIKTMRCTNQGSSYTSQDIEWACVATLPSTVRLDRTEVICEGYSNADDAYVLKGSCGVEYTLQLTEEGEEKHPELRGGGDKLNQVGWAEMLFGMVFVGVLGWIVYSACLRARENSGVGGAQHRRRRGGRGGGGGGGWGPGWGPGGGGGGGWDDPPPPYPGSGPKPSSSTSTEQGWRPGFWSGLASGAAAGYMAGNRGQRNNDRNYGRGGGFWGNDGGAGSRGSGSGPGWGSGRSSSSSSSGSVSRHESTGYGSTSRR